MLLFFFIYEFQTNGSYCDIAAVALMRGCWMSHFRRASVWSFMKVIPNHVRNIGDSHHNTECVSRMCRPIWPVWRTNNDIPLGFLDPWRRRRYAISKRRDSVNLLLGVTTSSSLNPQHRRYETLASRAEIVMSRLLSRSFHCRSQDVCLCLVF